jgi:predicted signal transduction protein with EAL and GGDEF domain
VAPFELECQPIRLGARVGSALFPEDGYEVEVLVDKADQEMFRKKRCRERRAQP